MKVGDYEKSLIKSRLLQQAIALKDDNLIAGTYNTIAANFDQLAECDKAYFYYLKALTYCNKTNNNVLKNWINNNLETSIVLIKK
jgi:hypothetical protein